MKTYSKIQGITFANSEQYVKLLKRGEILTLEREPTNSFDKNAIKIRDKNNNFLGYVGAPLAKDLAPRIDAGTIFFVTVSEITGGTLEKPNVGCNIKFIRRDIVK